MSTIQMTLPRLLSRSLGTGIVLATLPAAALAQAIQYNADPLASNPALGDLVRGPEALARLGDRLTEHAQRSQLSDAEFEQQVLLDENLWVDVDGDVVFVESLFGDVDAPQRADDLPSFKNGPTIPTSDAFLLHSRPGSNFTIYLDFDGHHSVNNAWGHDITFPAYNTEGGTGSFSQNELRQIIDHWIEVAEDYSTFDVDVTTEEPPVDRLRKSGGGDTQWGVRDVHTQATAGFGNGIGGVAQLGSFTWSTDTPVFSFNKGSGAGGMTGSHETGHAFGLVHDGLNGSAYHQGVALGSWSWGPIMGAPFGADMVQWSNGDYSGSTSTQNDTNVISSPSNGTLTLGDDHGDTIATATQIPADCPNPNQVEICGLIEHRSDVDTFQFMSVGGQISFVASPTTLGNVDCFIEIYDPNGVRLVGANQTRTATATIIRNIGPGVHTLLIDGGDQPNLYSDFGSRGHYVLDLTLPGAPSHFSDLGNALAGTNGLPVLTGSGFTCEGTSVAVSLSNASANSLAFLTYGVNRADAPLFGGVLVPDTGAGGGALSTTTSGVGEASMGGLWPAGTMSGATMYFQYWIKDPNAPQGWAASNAVVITQP